MAATIQFGPPNPVLPGEPANVTSGVLQPGQGPPQARDLRVRTSPSTYSYNVMIGDGDSWTRPDQIPHIERFKVTCGATTPFRIDPEPFQSNGRPFDRVKFVLDNSNPNLPVLRAVAR